MDETVHRNKFVKKIYIDTCLPREFRHRVYKNINTHKNVYKNTSTTTIKMSS